MNDMVRAEAQPMATAKEQTWFDTTWRLARVFVAGGMMPKHLRTPEAVFSVIVAGHELGLSPMQSCRAIYFIDGKVTLSADLMVALAKRHEDCEYFRVVESTNAACTAETKRRGEEPTRMSWTMGDAATAGLTGKDNWKKYPKAMLRARVSTDLVRAVYPDALMGVYDPDELGAKADTTPLRKAPPPPASDRQIIDAETGEVTEAAAAPEPESDPRQAIATFRLRIDEADSTAGLVDLAQELKGSPMFDAKDAKFLRQSIDARRVALGAA